MFNKFTVIAQIAPNEIYYFCNYGVKFQKTGVKRIIFNTQELYSLQ